MTSIPKTVVEARRSEWAKIKRARSLTELLANAFQLILDTTDVNGEITVNYTDYSPQGGSASELPAMFAMMYPGGSVDPTHNHVIYISDITLDTSVTFKVVEWDTAVIGTDTVLLETATPVEGMNVEVMLFFSTALI